MTGIESPVTITTSTGATSARCECGWFEIWPHHQHPAATAPSLANKAWAEHWHTDHAIESFRIPGVTDQDIDDLLAVIRGEESETTGD